MIKMLMFPLLSHSKRGPQRNGWRGEVKKQLGGGGGLAGQMCSVFIFSSPEPKAQGEVL